MAGKKPSFDGGFSNICEGAMKTNGLTFIEVMIAMALLITAMAGVSIVFVTGQRLVEGGLRQVDVQKEIQVIGERITRWIRPASSFTITDGGDRIDIVVPLSINPLREVTRRIYFDDYDDKIYYDADINDGNSAVAAAEEVYKIPRQVIFSSPSSNIVYVRFGVASEYRRITIQPMELSLRVKIRNVD